MHSDQHFATHSYDELGSSYTKPSTSSWWSGDEPLVKRDARRVRSLPDGAIWTVYEMVGVDIPGSRGRACLIFDSVGCVRRVWSFPDDWRAMSDEALLRVSLGR